MILRLISDQIRDYIKISCYENSKPNESSITEYSALVIFDEDMNNVISNTNENVYGRNFKLLLWATVDNDELKMDNLLKRIKTAIHILETTNSIWNVPLDKINYSYAGKDKNTNQKIYEMTFYMEYEE